MSATDSITYDGTRSLRSSEALRGPPLEPGTARETIEDQLVAELAALARASSEVQVFVALLAHEVRTRLKVTERALTRADEEGLRVAGENTRSLQELVEDLLELARTRRGARADGGEAMRLVAQDVADGDVDIVVRDLPTVSIAPALLRTVLRNLVANAIEAGASHVEVFAWPDGTICVRDDGPGVPAAVAGQMFGAYSGKFGGAGLGLALCREILRRHGGELWLDPPSSFCFRVP